MCLIKWFKKMRKRRRDRIYEGSYEDGGVIVNDDPQAKKSVESRDLISFYLKYSTLAFLEEDTNLKSGVYCLGACLEKDGSAVSCTVDCSEGIDVGSVRKERRSIEFLSRVDEILKKYDVASRNGYYHNVQGLPDFYGVKVDASYSSGESIYCFDNQEAFLPFELLRELCTLFDVKNITPKDYGV